MGERPSRFRRATAACAVVAGLSGIFTGLGAAATAPVASASVGSFTDRIAVLQDGAVKVQEGGPQSDWNGTVVTEPVLSFKVDGDRIGVLKPDHTLWVKEGHLNASWSKIGDDVQSFDLEGDTIGVLVSGNTLKTKAGQLNASWHDTPGVTAFDLAPGRVGVTTTTGQFKVQEGGLDGNWEYLTENVSSFRLDGSRVGALIGNKLYVKEGGLRTDWYVTDGVSNFDMAGDRIPCSTTAT